MNTIDIIIRLLLSILIGGAIGYEREYKNMPAGFRTHMLVCVGATIITMIQVTMTQNTINMILQEPLLADVIKVDNGRLVAQIVSGIGFLGAGTILHTKGSIKGLTTAASLWVVAALGIAIGYGYYVISILGLLACIIVLVSLKKLQSQMFSKAGERKIEIEFLDRKKILEELEELFYQMGVKIINIEFPMDAEERYYEDSKLASCLYTIILPRAIDTNYLISKIIKKESVINVRQIIG